MSRERWFRSEDEGFAFDWSRPACELDVPVDVARALYLRAMQLAADVQYAETLYLRWLRDAAAVRRPATPPAVPGRVGVAVDAGEADRAWHLSDLGRLVPGKWTRVLVEHGGEDARLSGTAAVRGAVPTTSSSTAWTPDRLVPGKSTRVLLEGGDGGPRLPGVDDVRLAMQALVSSRAPAAQASVRAAGAGAEPPQQREVSAVAPDVPAGSDALRDQLLSAVASGRGIAEALAAADSTTATSVLRAFRTEYVPGRAAPVLRLVTQAAGGEVERVLGRGSAGTELPADLAARLGQHVGAKAARAARLHTDDTADLVAAAHHARALTVGTDIYFARSEYAPGTERGDELLAHELTHVAQGQRGELLHAAAKGVDSGGPLDPAEAEADLRARLAAIQLHPPDAALPTLAAPSSPPASPDDRTALLAAQQERILLADQVLAPLDVAPAPPAVSPQAPVPNPAPEMTAPAAPASTGNAYVDALDALPSRQAMELWATAGTEATAQAAADQASFDAALPPMPVMLEGCEAAATPAGAATEAAPVATQTTDPGATPPAAQTAPTPEVPAVTAADAVMETVQASPDQAQMQANAQQAIDTLPTTAPDVQTNPGPAPMTDLAGQADPVRTLGDHQQAVSDSAAALDAARTQIVTGPGAAQVQPLALDEQLTVPAAEAAGALPALPTIDGMVKLKGWNLPANVQASFDDVAGPQMDASLAQARTQMTEAETTRDADRTQAVTDAQDRVRQAHADADSQQQAQVAETRARIANQQADTLVQYENQFKLLDQQVGDRKTSTISRINERITADQATVDSNFQDAQRRADERKAQGEAEAAQKKQDAQDQANNQSWWDQVVNAICDAIQAIADEITEVLDAIGTAIGQILDEVKTAACAIIDAARDFVCQALTEFGDWLTSAVDALIGSVFPELAAALTQLIDQTVSEATTAINQLADDLRQAVTELCDGLKAAVDGIIAAFQAAVQAAVTFVEAALTGDWDLVARMVIDGILAALGIDPAAFYALVGTAADSLEKIVEDPGAFAGHLIDAVGLGFRQFGDNFLTYLQDGLVQWLVGTLGEAGIQMPASFDLAGIFDLVCQVLGLTWPRLREKVVNLIGEENTERLEFVAQYIQAFLTGGFAGLWEQVQQDLSNLWDMVVGGIQDWLMQNVVQAAIVRIATMWNPVGAILQLIQTAWNAYQWLRENAQRIFGLVEAVVNSISNIVAGDISGAANFVEASLARLVPMAISLFADLLGLGGIAGEIQRIIGDVQTLVDEAIDALIERVKAMFRGGDEPPGDGDDRTLEQKQADVETATAEATELLKQEGATEGSVKQQLPPIKDQYKLVKLDLVVESEDADKERVHVHGEINPTDDGETVELPTGKTFRGAKKSDGTFEGNFDHPDWSWEGYPVNPVMVHPANEFLHYQKDATVPRPTGAYKITGLEQSPPVPQAWRDHLTARKDEIKATLLATLSDGDAENAAKRQVEDEYRTNDYSYGWLDLCLYNLDDSNKFQAHHIHPSDWNGVNEASNLQYLAHAQHHPFTTWWQDRKNLINRELDKQG